MIPPIFQAIQRAGAVTTQDMLETFNMGVGMALACRATEAIRLIRLMAREQIAAWVIGAIERRSRRGRGSSADVEVT